jgi:hypothetical protein
MRVCDRTRFKFNKNKSFKYSPVVVFSNKNDEAGDIYPQRQIQTNVAGMDFHCRANCVVSLRKEYALYNPPFL